MPSPRHHRSQRDRYGDDTHGRNDDIEAGRRYQLIANVGLGVGIVGLGAGATLFVLSANKGPAREASQTALRVGPASVSLEGRF